MNTEEDFKVELSKLQTKKDDVIIVKFTEDVAPDSFHSLQKMIGSIKEDANLSDVNFVILPKHITLTRLEDEDLEKIGLKRISDE